MAERPRPYDYAHRTGVRRFGWDEIAAMSQELAERLEREQPDVVIGVARAGVLPAMVIASALRCELLAVRLSRRVDDEVRFEHPVWHVPVPPAVRDKTVVVVDEIADSGETLGCVRASALRQGAARVLSAALVAHSWAEPRPDVVALVSDELVVFPWDERILANGRWIPLPEVEAAIRAQQRNAEPG